MSATLADIFRSLSSFEPKRVDLRGAPWDSYVDWAVAQGLAPLAAYNVEYRMGGAGAPQWARDRLLSIYQGSLNDNVMKLVNFKRSVDALEGRRVILLGAGCFAECVYPHIAFRPVAELELLLPKGDVEGFAGFMKHAEFKPENEVPAEARSASAVLTDGRTQLFCYGEVLDGGPLQAGLFERAMPSKVYGPSLYRLDLEDALLFHTVSQARRGYEVPMIEFIDLRELVAGAPSLGGPYSRLPRADIVLERASAWGAERALFASLSVVEALFPESAANVAPFKPKLSTVTRELIERLLVAPLTHVGRTTEFKGEEALRRVLSGG
ncbi:MAG: nucleotidyltransferase family protein [Myxococcaceae bacterium]|nr:nucleotidyltransferase family protein [Myxococcaceae bacterium]